MATNPPSPLSQPTDQTPKPNAFKQAFTNIFNPQHEGAGTILRGILAAGLTGLAGGVEANRQGALGPMGALAGGFMAQQRATAQNQQAQAQAEQQSFENSQKQKAADQVQQRIDLEKAQNAMMQQRTTADITHMHNLDEDAKTRTGLERDQLALAHAEARGRAIEQFNNLVKAGYKPVSSLDFKSPQEAMQWAIKHPDMVMKSPNGTDFGLVMSYNPDKNTYTLMEGEGREYRSIKLPNGKEAEVYATSAEYYNMLLQVGDLEEKHSLDLSTIARNRAAATRDYEEGQRSALKTADEKGLRSSLNSATQVLNKARENYARVSQNEPSTSPLVNEAKGALDDAQKRYLEIWDRLNPEAKSGLTEDNQKLVDKITTGKAQIEAALKGGMAPDKILAFLKDTPGYEAPEVQQALAAYLQSLQKQAPTKSAQPAPDQIMGVQNAPKSGIPGLNAPMFP